MSAHTRRITRAAATVAVTAAALLPSAFPAQAAPLPKRHEIVSVINQKCLAVDHTSEVVTGDCNVGDRIFEWELRNAPGWDGVGDHIVRIGGDDAILELHGCLSHAPSGTSVFFASCKSTTAKNQWKMEESGVGVRFRSSSGTCLTEERTADHFGDRELYLGDCADSTAAHIWSVV
ncbi:ricin-type beta-trefoil lectin domain protein [Streptomyces sp. SID3343]|uniref:ricin-type beta-trefoil lectin domain protein n=1 Tax=Streptomyces sp. SID3343 TaxID=2690260 RepID=UPI00136A1904|nr:ricin-type beta-trefoil lectin domain protein [Streptomyces sp. SID3343]MYV97744.1 hypothetical protein [Streptomyces sp. SID3343]